MKNLTSLIVFALVCVFGCSPQEDAISNSKAKVICAEERTNQVVQVEKRNGIAKYLPNSDDVESLKSLTMLYAPQLLAVAGNNDSYACQQNLGLIWGAKFGYIGKTNSYLGAKVNISDLDREYWHTQIYCPSAPKDQKTFEDSYKINRIGIPPECRFHPTEHVSEMYVVPPEEKPIVRDSEQIKFQAELKNVADCFRSACEILMEEPPHASLDMGSFIRRAQKKLAKAPIGDFVQLHWIKPWKHELIALSNGDIVRHRIANVDEIYNNDGTRIVILSYEFYAECSTSRGRIKVHLKINNPPRH